VSLLAVEELRAGYGRGEVLHGLSLELQAGEVVSLLGANGAGKTTTLRAISGMVRSTGSVRFDGRAMIGRSPDAIARLGVAHVPQGRGILAPLTVEENLRLGASARRNRSGLGDDIDRCLVLFPRLAERRAQRAGLLSGGEQQMLALGRALIMRPRLLLLDEPSLGLAPKITREVFAVLGELRAQEGMSLLVVEQNAELALGLADRAYVLESGTVALAGPAERIRGDAGTRRAYLGY
jgi:branched-chain amino acid transport system ATP-binding protein